MELFEEYLKLFDINIPEIKRKYDHSYRVAQIAKDIAVSINVDERIAYLSGLFHDIGRFNQWMMYHTYKDCDSVDHGNLGFDVFFNDLDINSVFSLEEIGIIADCIKYHNKLEVLSDLGLSDVYVRIVRDADKIDIIRTQMLLIDEENVFIKDELLNEFLNGKCCSNKYVMTQAEYVLRMISWINDINFDYSMHYLDSNGIIEGKIKLLQDSSYDRILEVREYVDKVMERRK